MAGRSGRTSSPFAGRIEQDGRPMNATHPVKAIVGVEDGVPGARDGIDHHVFDAGQLAERVIRPGM
jgi:hypothetical protein